MSFPQKIRLRVRRRRKRQTDLPFREKDSDKRLIRSAWVHPLSLFLSLSERAKTTAINASIIENNAQTKLSSRSDGSTRFGLPRNVAPFLSCRPLSARRWEEGFARESTPFPPNYFVSVTVATNGERVTGCARGARRARRGAVSCLNSGVSGPRRGSSSKTILSG